jgi:hypothetical protein
MVKTFGSYCFQKWVLNGLIHWQTRIYFGINFKYIAFCFSDFFVKQAENCRWASPTLIVIFATHIKIGSLPKRTSKDRGVVREGEWGVVVKTLLWPLG